VERVERVERVESLAGKVWLGIFRKESAHFYSFVFIWNPFEISSWEFL
jgi:hypothetical protein